MLRFTYFIYTQGRSVASCDEIALRTLPRLE